MSSIKIGTYLVALCLWIGIVSVVATWLRTLRIDAAKWYTSPLVSLSLLLLGAGVFLFSNDVVINRLGIEDALEYYVAADRFSQSGSYSLSLNGQEFAPRFPPFFSTVLIAPFIDLGALCGLGGMSFAFLPVMILSLVGLGAAFLLGNALTNIWGGIAAFLACLLLPEFRYFSGYLMTDAPFAALWLLSLLCFLTQVEAHDPKKSRWLVAGLLVAGAFGLRPLGVALLLPWLLLFIVQTRGRRLLELLPDGAMLLGPLVILVVGNLAYNLKTFGSMFRTGYHYWMSIPYDFKELTFSLSYVVENVLVLANETAVLPALFVLVAIYVATRRSELDTVFVCKEKRVRAVFLYTILPAIALICFHSLYFYSSSRFFLPLSILMISLAGGVLGGFINKDRGLYTSIVCLGVSAALAVAPLYRAESSEQDLSAILKLKDSIPPAATVVSAHNPLLMEHFLGHGTRRRVVPWSRDLPYSSKFVASVRPDNINIQGATWSDHRFEDLATVAEIVDPYPVVLQENPKVIAELLERKRPVYVDTSLLTQEDIKWINDHFFVTRLDNGFFYLRDSCLNYD